MYARVRTVGEAVCLRELGKSNILSWEEQCLCIVEGGENLGVCIAGGKLCVAGGTMSVL